MRLRKDIKRLKESERQSHTWSDKIENTKNGIKVSGVKPDKGHIGHKSAKMMQKSKNLKNRLDKAIEEKKNLLKDVESKEGLSLYSLRHHKERRYFRQIAILRMITSAVGCCGPSFLTASVTCCAF